MHFPHNVSLVRIGALPAVCVCVSVLLLYQQCVLLSCCVMYMCSCIPELTVAWSRELSSGPFSAAPLIADIDADSHLDVAVASFTGDVDVIRASDSEHKRGAHWPLRLTDASVHSSPLQVATIRYHSDHQMMFC